MKMCESCIAALGFAMSFGAFAGCTPGANPNGSSPNAPEVPVPSGRAVAPSASAQPIEAGAPATSDATIAPLANPACIVRDANASLDANLRAQDAPFAVAGFGSAEIRLAPGASGGTAAITRKDATIIGEIRLEEVRFRMQPLVARDGWLVITRAPAISVGEGSVVSRPKLPAFVSTSVPLEITLACSELGIGGASYDTTRRKESHLRLGMRSAIRVAAGGATVATVDVPSKLASNVDERSLVVQVLEPGATETKIRLMGEETRIEGWVDTAILTKPSETGFFGSIGMLSAPPDLEEKQAPRCRHDVSIYVRSKQVVTRVGAFRPLAPIKIDAERSSGTEAVVHLGYGLSRRGALDTFVRRASLEGCTRGSEDAWPR